MTRIPLGTKFILMLVSISVFVPMCPEGVAQTLPDVTPAIEWKYGWQDGRRANTIGGARRKNVLPLASGVPSTGYLPSQIAKAYGFDRITGANATGIGQKIAVVVAYGSPYLQADLNKFNSQYGLPSISVPVYYPSGAPATVDPSWAAETTLDVEWCHAMAPGASIVVVAAPNASGASLLNAVNYATGTLKATVVSMSWGAAEFAGSSAYDSYFGKPGVSFVASSGDSGAGVSWPAVSTNVVAVGGTSLLYDTSTGMVASETAWNGSGGGESAYVGIPSYQLGWNTAGVTNQTSTQTNNLTTRGVPDVSYVADPYTGVSVYFTDPSTRVGGWFVFGGTSAGAPQWAALLARRAALGNAGTMPFNPAAYSASKASYATLFRDIASGSNGHPAKTGYDVVTGLGSPLAGAIAAMSSSTSTTSPSPTPTPTPTPVKGKKTALVAAQFPAALSLMDQLNQSFVRDAYAGNPGGRAFFTDGVSVLSSAQAWSAILRGGSVTLDFYARLSRPEYLPANPITWMMLRRLAYTRTALMINDGFGFFPVYELDLGAVNGAPAQTGTSAAVSCRRGSDD